MLDNYNERLFNGKSFRSRLHIARYVWLQKKLKDYNCNPQSILELGCFDGKMLEFLTNPPKQYEGYDANWEGGLELGRLKYKDYPNYRFKLCEKTADFCPAENQFDLSVCQETAEHLPVEDLDYYLETMAKATTGYCFISVPNEKGIVFLAKHFAKLVSQEKKERENISFKEIVYSTLGQTHKVKRDVRYHKGFNYKTLRTHIEKYFVILQVDGIPFPALGPSLNFTVGFICKRK